MTDDAGCRRVASIYANVDSVLVNRAALRRLVAASTSTNTVHKMADGGL